MFSCEFCEISHNTIFKGPKKLSISAKKRHCAVDVRPGSKYASLSSHEKVQKSEKLKLEKFLSLLQILYTDHKFIRSSVTWAYLSVDNHLWKRTSQKRAECFSKTC